MAPSSIEILRDLTDDACAAYHEVMAEAYDFALARTPEFIAKQDRAPMRAVVRDGRVVGGAKLNRFAQYYGGRPVPMGGVGGVAIAVEHRRERLGERLMRALLGEMVERGDAVSMLYPATEPLYRKVGYAPAGRHDRYVLPCESFAHVRFSSEVVAERVTSDRELRPIYAAWAATQPGHLARSDFEWGRKFAPLGQPPSTAFILREHGGLVGYVIVARGEKGGRDRLVVRDYVALTASAASRIVGLCADHRSVVEDVALLGGGLRPHLLEAVHDPHLITIEDPNTWMLRIIDVTHALTARGYPLGLDLEVAFTVVDPWLQHNAGSYRLQVKDGQGQVSRGPEPGVVLDISALASLYSGYTTPHALMARGLCTGTPTQLSQLATVFAGASPWCADFF